MPRRLPVLLATIVVCALPGRAGSQTAPRAGAGQIAYARADTAALHRFLDSLAATHRGVLGYTVHNLDTGERLERRADETFPTASLIKVAVLVTVYDLVERQQLALDDPLTVLRIDKVPGSGQLQHLHDNAVVTRRETPTACAPSAPSSRCNPASPRAF